MGYQYQNEQVTVNLNMNTILVDPVYQHGARVLARVQNSTTWLLMTLDPTAQDLTLWATLNNNWTELAVISQPISINAWYHAKLDVIGNLVEGKVWAFGATEPGWQIAATQQIVNGAGQAGLRTTGAYVQYANFQETPITQVSGIVSSANSGAPIANATRLKLIACISLTSEHSLDGHLAQPVLCNHDGDPLDASLDCQRSPVRPNPPLIFGAHRFEVASVIYEAVSASLSCRGRRADRAR